MTREFRGDCPISPIKTYRVTVMIENESDRALRGSDVVNLPRAQTGLPIADLEKAALIAFERALKSRSSLSDSGRVRRLLSQIADRGTCKSCGVEIWWVKMPSGRLNPFTADAVSHFSDCPSASKHRKEKDESQKEKS
jgi:hypothetical protein